MQLEISEASEFVREWLYDALHPQQVHRKSFMCLAFSVVQIIYVSFFILLLLDIHSFVLIFLINVNIGDYDPRLSLSKSSRSQHVLERGVAGLSVTSSNFVFCICFSE